MRIPLRDAIFDLSITLVIINALFAAGFLIRELASRPHRFRKAMIVLLLAVAILIALQLTTDYYFAFPNAEHAVIPGAIFAYILAMTLVLSARRMAAGLNRIVGGLGFAIPIALLLLSRDLAFASLIAIFGFGPNTPAFQGRISPDSSYVISIDHVLYGGASYYRYTVFHNPRWFSIVRKQTVTGPMRLCEVPAIAAGVSPTPRENEWRVWCRPTQTTLVSTEVSPANIAAQLPPQIPK